MAQIHSQFYGFKVLFKSTQPERNVQNASVDHTSSEGLPNSVKIDLFLWRVEMRNRGVCDFEAERWVGPHGRSSKSLRKVLFWLELAVGSHGKFLCRRDSKGESSTERIITSIPLWSHLPSMCTIAHHAPATPALLAVPWAHQTWSPLKAFY